MNFIGNAVFFWDKLVVLQTASAPKHEITCFICFNILLAYVETDHMLAYITYVVLTKSGNTRP